MKKNSFVRRISPLLFLFLFSAACTYGQLLNVTMSTTPSCSLNGTATATVTGGTPPYSYAWYSPSPLVGSIPWSTSNTITGMPGSPYYVSVTDAGSGYGSTSFIIPSAFTATRSVTHDQCGAGVGTASVAITGGTPPFSYNWSNGQNTATATGLSPGIYFVTITDAAGCFISSQTDSLLYFQIWNTSPLTLTTTFTNSTCTDGTASVTNVANGTPPYTYVWSTIPPQFTPSVTGLGVGSHYVTVTDAAGCSNEKSFYISQLPNGITANVTTTNEFCQQSNGTASLMVSGGMAPYTYLWSNGATTSSIAGLSYGSYAVTVTDALGCPKVVWAIVHRTDPLTLTMTGTQANCSNTGGSASVTVAGGTPPYTYLWSNGATTNAISGLSAGYYYVHVTDGNGCQDYSFYHCIQPQSCFATISGNLLSDMNSNCFPDGADYVLEGKIVQVGSSWTTSNSNGDYSKTVLPGTYAISQSSMLNNFQVVCPGTGTINLSNVLAGSNYPGNDFFNGPISNINDLEVWIYANPARATQHQTVWIYYRNIGTTILNSTLTFTHDALMTLNWGYNQNTYNLGTRTLTYNLGQINPGETGYRLCDFTIPQNTPIQTPYTHVAEIFPNNSDATPLNNISTFNNVVYGPFDPNRKSVSPDGLLQPGTDSILTYFVEFQNVGTDTAFTVAIRDTLDPALDGLSIEVLGSSHTMTWDIDNPGYLAFTFDNIELPDSHINEAASHGWLMYRIKVKPNLSLGTQIRNKAAIYFDYNLPIITNSTLNTFGLVGVDPRLNSDAGFKLYPNPALGQVQLLLDDSWSNETAVSVLDLSGKSILTTVINPADSRLETLNLHALPKGIYLVECRTDQKRQVKKLILQ